MLTVLLATKNRARILREVLEAYCRLEAPVSGWKVVVVDNGSTDETPEVLASFAARLPLQWIVEPQAGKNVALNAGLKLAEGDLCVFTDDDAFPRADWLVQLRKAADAQPGCAMFGGVVLPRWEATPPNWFRWVNQAAVFTLTEPGLEEGMLDPREIYGPNMAVRAEIFTAGVSFDPGIGPSGASYAMGSETELVTRLGRLGHKAWHVKDAVVEHFIRVEQLQQSWVLERAVRFGRGQYRLYGPGGRSNPPRFRGVPMYLYRKMLKQAVLAAAGRIAFQPEIAFRAHWRLNVFRGEVYEARMLAKEGRPATRVAHVGAGSGR